MALRLVSANENRALHIRDHVLPLIRACGALESQDGLLRVIVWRCGIWSFKHWTPFTALGSQEAASPGYRHALERQYQVPMMPYGLEIWQSEKLLSMLWADTNLVQVITFDRGPWENDALAL